MERLPSYDRIAILLHWLIAAGIVAQISLGWWMIDIPKLPAGVRAYWFNLHKSIGLTLATLIVIRIVWRLTHRPPALPTSVPRWQVRVASMSHVLMYVCMIVMPLAGYLGSIYSGYPIKYFGSTLPGWGGTDDALKDFFSTVHYGTAWIFMSLIALHIAAAMKHLLLDRDIVVARMWPRARPGRTDTAPIIRRQGT